MLTITPRSPSASGSFFAHRRGRQAEHVERAHQVDLDHLAKQVQIVRPVAADDPRRAENAGAAHQAVQPAEMLDGQRRLRPGRSRPT